MMAGSNTRYGLAEKAGGTAYGGVVAIQYLPSYLVLAEPRFHILFATDVEGDNIRIVTAYRPDLDVWQTDLKTRRRDQ